MEKIKELPEFVLDPKTGNKLHRPKSDLIEQWSREVSELYQKFLQLQKEGRLSK
jgi:hypothetical protein